MKLGEILIQLGMLTPDQVRAMLSDRSLVGGKLGTQIVERGLLSTDQVSEALGRQMRMPAALQRHFDKADPAIVALLKPKAWQWALYLLIINTGSFLPIAGRFLADLEGNRLFIRKITRTDGKFQAGRSQKDAGKPKRYYQLDISQP